MFSFDLLPFILNKNCMYCVLLGIKTTCWNSGSHSWFYVALADPLPLNTGDNLALEGKVWDFSTVSDFVSMVSNWPRRQEIFKLLFWCPLNHMMFLCMVGHQGKPYEIQYESLWVCGLFWEVVHGFWQISEGALSTKKQLKINKVHLGSLPFCLCVTDTLRNKYLTHQQNRW